MSEFHNMDVITKVCKECGRPIFEQASPWLVCPIYLNGTLLKLTPKERCFMDALASNKGEVAFRNYIMDFMYWNTQDPPFSKIIDVYKTKIISKCGDKSIIKSHWGIGYRLNAKVEYIGGGRERKIVLTPIKEGEVVPEKGRIVPPISHPTCNSIHELLSPLNASRETKDKE